MILASFAVIVGVLTNRQVRTQFDDSQASAIGRLYSELKGNLVYDRSDPLTLDWSKVDVSLTDFAGAEPAQIRIFDDSDGYLLGTQNDISGPGYRAPAPGGLFATAPYQTSGYFVQSGYRVAVKELDVRPSGHVTLLYAVPLSSLNHTINRIDAFLALGVLGGTVMALLAGLFVSARAMRPITELTDTAREIERTRDPSLSVPHPEAKDEIAQLARTLEGMLAALGAARAETQSMLDRQREFVADASHELRTPLTSVLANLELLNEELTGEQAETAEAALRSTRRMRRLVGDLLLLARADARRAQPHRPTDLGQVLVEAASELGPVADRHELSISAEPVVVSGVRDELHRLILNLLENAVRHTPPGTTVSASTHRDGGEAVIVVEDSGPGIAPALAARVFERFVRGGRDGGKGSGLGLAIVRSVAQSHGGMVDLQPALEGTGTRFEVRIPLPKGAAEVMVNGDGDGQAPAQTSTTTGRTIGRRRSRS